MRTLNILIFIVFLPFLVFSGVKGNNGGIIFFGEYEPIELKTINDLPTNIKIKLEKHLINRLGLSFYQSLIFSGGQKNDIDKLHKQNPDSYNYHWTIPAYHLNIIYRNESLGIDEYQTSIDLDIKGKIIEEIKLPYFTKWPEKYKMISHEVAHKIAKENGFNIDKSYSKIDYDVDEDIFIYVISEEVSNNSFGATIKNISINVHNGNIIKIFASNILF